MENYTISGNPCGKTKSKSPRVESDYPRYAINAEQQLRRQKSPNEPPIAMPVNVCCRFYSADCKGRI